jgi:WD40 repeat protein
LIYNQNGLPPVCRAVARVWEISNGGQLADISQGDEGGINSMMYSPIDASYVLTGNNDGAARIWDIRSGREVIRITVGGNRDAVDAAFSPNGQYIVARKGGDMVESVWNARSGAEITSMTHADRITVMVFSPDSQYVVSGSADGVIIVWDAKSGREVARMVQEGSADDLVLSPSGRYIASVDPGKTSPAPDLPGGGGLRIWEPGTAPTPKAGIVRIWEAMSGREAAVITSPSMVDTMAFSPDGKYIAISGFTNPFKSNLTGIVSIREMLSGREIASYTHPTSVYSMLFTADGKYLITASDDQNKTIVVWDVHAGKEAARILSYDVLYNGDSLSLGPDDRYLVASGQPTRVWDLLSDGTQVDVRDELKENLTYITHSREVQSKSEISRFTYADARWAKFSPDGRYILTSGCDEFHYGSCNEAHIFISYWRVEDLAAEACRRLPRNFTRAEWAQYFPRQAYRATCPDLPLDPALTP